MKKQLLFISTILIAAVIILGFLVYQSTDKTPNIINKTPNNPYDFTPSITQGIYGTAIECHGSAMPPLKGKWNIVKINFKIKNIKTNEIIEITTQDNGRYEHTLKEGIYTIITPVWGIYKEGIQIENGTLIKENIVTKFCPV